MSISLIVTLGIALLAGFLLIRYNSVNNEAAKFRKNLEYVHFETDVILTKEELEKRVKTVGLAKHWDDIEAHLLDSIGFRTEVKSEEEIALGQSKIGGYPHLNASIALPADAIFFCQINCGEMSVYKTNTLVPDNGMLYFFLNPQKIEQNEPDAVSVLFLENQGGLCLRTDAVTMPDIQPCALQFFQSVSLPDWTTETLREFLKDYELDAYFKLTNQEQSHKLFGHPQTISQDIPEDGDNYLLLQLDSEESSGMLWKNMGRIYVFGDRKDSEKKEFKKITCCIQSYEGE